MLGSKFLYHRFILIGVRLHPNWYHCSPSQSWPYSLVSKPTMCNFNILHIRVGWSWRYISCLGDSHVLLLSLFQPTMVSSLYHFCSKHTFVAHTYFVAGNRKLPILSTLRISMRHLLFSYQDHHLLLVCIRTHVVETFGWHETLGWLKRCGLYHQSDNQDGGRGHTGSIWLSCYLIPASPPFWYVLYKSITTLYSYGTLCVDHFSYCWDWRKRHMHHWSQVCCKYSLVGMYFISSNQRG